MIRGHQICWTRRPLSAQQEASDLVGNRAAFRLKRKVTGVQKNDARVWTVRADALNYLACDAHWAAGN